ncbi:MAG: hypothetical protein GY725_09770 [bacterium]|nr:hypothetical protein [bacterium]
MTARFIAFQAALLVLLPSIALASATDDLSILSQSVPPKVVLLLDTSGSMQFAINHDDFNVNTTRWKFNDRHPLRLHDNTDGTYCNFGTVPEEAGTTGLCPGSQHASADDRCPDTDDFGSRRYGNKSYYCENMPSGCTNAPTGWTCWVAGSRTYLELPDYGPRHSTDWQRNYLHWIAQQMHAGNQLTLPAQDRIGAAKDAIKGLIDGINTPGLADRVHFGLARFELNSNGGYVLVPAEDGSRNDIFARLDDTTTTGYTSTYPNGGTPLSESLVDIGRYYVGSNELGDYSAYNRNDATGSVPDSPLDSTCRSAYVVVMTDGAPTNDLNIHHGGDFTSTIGNADGDTNESPDAWSGRTPTNYVLPYSSNSGSDWLDDVAYYLSHNDLIDDSVMEDDQSIYTYSVGFTIDHPLLDETGMNGQGDYFTTANADQLQADLEAALLSIIEKSSSLTSATVPASRSAFGDGFYTAFFIPSNKPSWKGHLQTYRLTPDLLVVDKNGNAALDISTNLFLEPRFPFWDAGDELASVSHPTRSLYTTKSSARTAFSTANIAAADLGVTNGELTSYPNDPAVPFATTETLTDGIVDYMIGTDAFDDDRDTDTAEKRSFVLGDIFHSNPISVGPPPSALHDEDGFGPEDLSGTFLYAQKARDRRIFAGANDGFLHAFNGGSFNLGDNPSTPETESGYYDLGNGQEVFGYVPGFMLDSVKMIPRNSPRANYYVDGSPAAADIWVPSSSVDVTKEGSEWTTLLVTGMRQGGAGYLALDVTDPGATVVGPHGPYPKLMWEFDDTSEPLGETWSEPIITRVRMKASTGVGDYCGRDSSDDGDCREQWVVIVGGGYDSKADPNLSTFGSDPNDANWTTSSKAIFMLAADTGDVLAKVAYDPNDSTLSKMKYSLASTPGVLDLDQDGLADVVYIGDLGGQLWKWDISEKGEDADLDGLVDSTVWPAGIYFSSPAANVGDIDGDGNDDYHYHSIFFPPIATYVDSKLLLAFASGERTDLKYEGAASSPATLEGLYDDNNRFWVIWDRVPIGSGAFDVEISEGYQTIGGTIRGINDITTLTSDNAPDDDGYYIKVPDGEKFIVNHIVFSGLTLALSYVPDNSGTDICNAVGESNVYIFGISDGTGALSSGTARSVKLGNGAPTDPRVSVSRDSNGNMIVELVGQTSLGEVLKLPVPADPPPPFSNVYWRQRF